ncbi:MAG: cytochrome c biogenesis protein [Myxococcales bacterium]|nr:cytochrome c biogenesis protein [Myxococcales bacterium]
MALLLLRVCVVLYGIAAMIGFIQLFSPRLKDERIGLVVLVLGVLGHLVAMGVRASELGTFPMANIHDALSLFGFSIASLSIPTLASARRVPQIGPIAALVVMVLVLLAVFIEPATTVPQELRSPWLPVHIALAFVGNASFVVAGMVAGVYLIQDNRLKLKRSRTRVGTGLYQLPALELLDRASMRLIEIGFPLMTLALVSGMLYGREVWGMYWKWELRNVVSVIVWAIFAVLLHFRITIGWRGRKAALLTLVGVSATLLSIVGLGLLGFGHYGQDYTS